MTTAAETRAWTPGLHDGVPFEDYLEIDAVSFSDLEAWVTRKAKSIGRNGLVGEALHALALEGGDAVKARFVKLEFDVDLRTTAGKTALADAESGGKRALKPSEWESVVGLYKGIQACERAKKALATPSKREVVVIARIKGFDTLVRTRLDLLHDRFLLDVKTTHWPTPEIFRDAIVQYNYAARAAFYVDAVAALDGKYRPFLWLCASSQEPYDAWIEQVSNEYLAFGRRWYQDVLTLYERYHKYDKPKQKEVQDE